MSRVIVTTGVTPPKFATITGLRRAKSPAPPRLRRGEGDVGRDATNIARAFAKPPRSGRFCSLTKRQTHAPA